MAQVSWRIQAGKPLVAAGFLLILTVLLPPPQEKSCLWNQTWWHLKHPQKGLKSKQNVPFCTEMNLPESVWVSNKILTGSLWKLWFLWKLRLDIREKFLWKILSCVRKESWDRDVAWRGWEGDGASGPWCDHSISNPCSAAFQGYSQPAETLEKLSKRGNIPFPRATSPVPSRPLSRH